MNISKLALIALLGSALMAFGCGDGGGDSGTAGSGGSAGTGGSAGSGGEGGTGGSGGVLACVPSANTCANGDIDPTDTSPCDLPAPPDEDGCVGDESLENPATCTAADNAITVVISQLEIDGDCNSGVDLDSCSGNSCILGGLAPAEGTDGVDNALAGLAPVLAGVGGNLGGVNDAFYAGLCAGDIVIGFTVDANTEENCANVDILDADLAVVRSIVMNFSDAACLSGTIGAIPLNVAGIPGEMGNAVLRGTISEGGLSNGSLSATVDQDTAGSIADQLIDGGSAVVAQVLDINNDLSGDVATGCDALSMTLNVGGVPPQ
ncbi:MAG: hypothetical protein JRG93_17960 [Deltaproteobacteria bacterium]|nr:hypothetical protein [Deltaproteobacteria bacterium]